MTVSVQVSKNHRCIGQSKISHEVPTVTQIITVTRTTNETTPPSNSKTLIIEERGGMPRLQRVQARSTSIKIIILQLDQLLRVESMMVVSIIIIITESTGVTNHLHLMKALCASCFLRVRPRIMRTEY